ERQQFAAVFGGPVVAQIDAGAAVGVAAAELVVNAQTLGVFDALAGVPMKMVGVRIDRVIDVAVRRDRRAAGVMRAGDEMKKVAGYRVCDDHLAVFVPVVPPGVGEAVAEDFEYFARRMIAPDSAVDRHALVLRAARRADPARTRSATAAVEPAVESPAEA